MTDQDPPVEITSLDPPTGEPWVVDAPVRPGYRHVVEFTNIDGVVDSVWEVDGDGYSPAGGPGSRARHIPAHSWANLLGRAWATGLTVRVCPLGHARHARMGAIRIAHRDADNPERVVIAGPPLAPAGTGDHPYRWVSITHPGEQFTDDEVDQPPWRALSREDAWKFMVPRDPA